MTKSKRLSRDQKNEIITSRKSGVSALELANKFGIKTSSVHVIVFRSREKCGDAVTSTAKLNVDMKNEICKSYHSSSSTEIAERYSHMTGSTISAAFVRDIWRRGKRPEYKFKPVSGRPLKVDMSLKSPDTTFNSVVR